jgi:hypothetical protein
LRVEIQENESGDSSKSSLGLKPIIEIDEETAKKFKFGNIKPIHEDLNWNGRDVRNSEFSIGTPASLSHGWF